MSKKRAMPQAKLSRLSNQRTSLDKNKKQITLAYRTTRHESLFLVAESAIDSELKADLTPLK